MSAHKTHTALDLNQSKRVGKMVAKGIFLWHYKSQGIGESSYVDASKHVKTIQAWIPIDVNLRFWLLDLLY